MNLPSNHTLILIRRATRADVPAIVRLMANDMLGQQREQYSDPLPPAYYVAFDAIIADEHQELVVMELEQEVVGTLQLTFIPYLTHQGSWRAQIESVRVDEAFRNRGMGQKLFEWAIERARQRGCNIVQLTTNTQRADAQRFYEKLGFVPSHIGMKLDLRG